jgi:oligosaccharide repeat unit polymerase
MRWSHLQEADISDANIFMVILFTTFLLVSFFYSAALWAVKPIGRPILNKSSMTYSPLGNLSLWYRAWILITILEIIYSGGIPILWTLTGSEKTYFDFGIPSIHGLANSLISSLTLISYYKYLTTSNKKYLIVSLAIIPWGVAVVSRQIVIVNLLQFIFCYFTFKTPSLFSIVRIILIGILGLLGFGWVGDLRTGADKFVSLAMPTEAYSDFFPSGFLWVYIYAVTPLMNLMNTFRFNTGYESYVFANTISPLFPSVLRQVLFPSQNIEKGDVISQAFNVSTAFVDPYADLGYVGVFLFIALISIVTHYFWYKRNINGALVYIVLAQCLTLTIFYNHFFSLPVITQIFWISLILRSHQKLFFKFLR